MIKTITIEGHSVKINTSAGWLYCYRKQFGRDVLPDLMPVLDGILSAAGVFLESDSGEIDNQDIARFINSEEFSEALWKTAGLETTTILNILWALACNADQNIQAPIKYFNQFDVFPVDVVLPEMLVALLESSVSSKNASSLLSMVRKLTPSISTSSPSQESTEG